jgi:hypothetical protein
MNKVVHVQKVVISAQAGIQIFDTIIHSNK